MKYLIIILSILPIVLIGIFYYKRDTLKEPTKLLRKLFLSGIASGLLVGFTSLIIITLFPSFKDTANLSVFNLFIYTFLAVALIEETFKWIMVYFISYKSPHYDQFYDIILYAVFVGLGFACFENLLYTIPNNDLFVTLFRGITAIPAHASYQTIMGYYLTLSKYYPQKKKLYIGLSIIVPVILHGLYDFFLYLNNFIFVVIFLIFIVLLFVFTILKTNQILNIDIKNLKK